MNASSSGARALASCARAGTAGATSTWCASRERAASSGSSAPGLSMRSAATAQCAFDCGAARCPIAADNLSSGGGFGRGDRDVAGAGHGAVLAHGDVGADLFGLDYRDEVAVGVLLEHKPCAIADELLVQ